MAFTPSVFITFFEQTNQMALSSRAKTRLVPKALANIDDFVYFKEDQIT